jgi:hypothetical protein
MVAEMIVTTPILMNSYLLPDTPKIDPITGMGVVASRCIIAVHFVRFRTTAKSGWRC